MGPPSSPPIGKILRTLPPKKTTSLSPNANPPISPPTGMLKNLPPKKNVSKKSNTSGPPSIPPNITRKLPPKRPSNKLINTNSRPSSSTQNSKPIILNNIEHEAKEEIDPSLLKATSPTKGPPI